MSFAALDRQALAISPTLNPCAVCPFVFACAGAKRCDAADPQAFYCRARGATMRPASKL